MKTLYPYSARLIFVFVLSLLLAAPGQLNAQYSITKQKYNYKDYSPAVGQPYIPALSGITSLIIPGFGQVITGEVGRGIGFFAGELGSFATFVLGFGLAWGGYDVGGVMMVLGFGSAVTIPIWSSVNAVRIAKVKNMEWSDTNKPFTGLNLSPGLQSLPNQKLAPSLTLSLNF